MRRDSNTWMEVRVQNIPAFREIPSPIIGSDLRKRRTGMFVKAAQIGCPLDSRR